MWHMSCASFSSLMCFVFENRQTASSRVLTILITKEASFLLVLPLGHLSLTCPSFSSLICFCAWEADSKHNSRTNGSPQRQTFLWDIWYVSCTSTCYHMLDRHTAGRMGRRLATEVNFPLRHLICPSHICFCAAGQADNSRDFSPNGSPQTFCCPFEKLSAAHVLMWHMMSASSSSASICYSAMCMTRT